MGEGGKEVRSEIGGLEGGVSREGAEGWWGETGKAHSVRRESSSADSRPEPSVGWCGDGASTEPRVPGAFWERGYWEAMGGKGNRRNGRTVPPVVGRDYPFRGLLGWWQDDGVDHVDDAVAADDVGGDDFGTCDGDAAFGGDLGGGAVDCLHVTCLDVFGEDFAGDDVIGEDSGELGLVFRLEEFFDGALRELGEGFVGWGEDGEWAFTGEGFGETGGFDCGDERGEVLITGGDFDHRLFFVRGGGDGAELEGSGDGGEEEECFHMD